MLLLQGRRILAFCFEQATVREEKETMSTFAGHKYMYISIYEALLFI